MPLEPVHTFTVRLLWRLHEQLKDLDVSKNQFINEAVEEKLQCMAKQAERKAKQ